MLSLQQPDPLSKCQTVLGVQGGPPGTSASDAVSSTAPTTSAAADTAPAPAASSASSSSNKLSSKKAAKRAKKVAKLQQPQQQQPQQQQPQQQQQQQQQQLWRPASLEQLRAQGPAALQLALDRMLMWAALLVGLTDNHSAVEDVVCESGQLVLDVLEVWTYGLTH